MGWRFQPLLLGFGESTLLTSIDGIPVLDPGVTFPLLLGRGVRKEEAAGPCPDPFITSDSKSICKMKAYALKFCIIRFIFEMRVSPNSQSNLRK